jgi:hypothetical protein
VATVVAVLAFHWPPTGDDLDSFLGAFWPGFVATVLGVLGGVLGAMWVERKRTEHAERRKATERAQRLREVAAEIVTSLNYNRTQLLHLADSLTKGIASLTSAVETATWEMRRADVAELFPDPSLRERLARFHFELGRIAQISDGYADTVTKAALEDSPESRAHARVIAKLLKEHVEIGLERLDSLLADVKALNASDPATASSGPAQAH